ncbi:MAG: AMIN domain-containing protein [Pseudodesulfovibrio sp.]
MLKIFYRRFYILLFLVWLGATAGLFVLSVWGDFSTFVTDFSEIIRVQNEQDEMVIATRDAATQAVGKVMHKTRVAESVVRKKIGGEMHAVEEVVEEAVEEVIGVKPHISHDEQAEEVVERRAQALLKQSRQHNGAGKLTSIAFTQTNKQLVAHLQTSKSVDLVTRFWLDGPTRLIVDLRGNWRNGTSGNRSSLTDSFVYQVILGTHSDRLRVVFRFDDPKAPMGELPELIYTDDGLDIVVANPAK